VAGLQKRLPSQLQTLAAVRDQVVKDYSSESKALAQAKDAGEKFASAVQVGLAQGKSFDAVCAAQNVKPVSFPRFARHHQPAARADKPTFQQLQETVFTLPTEQSSKFIPTSDGGFVAYVKARLPVDEARMKEELPFYLANMREQRQSPPSRNGWAAKSKLRLIPPPGEHDASRDET
jgi:hypothetical protein